MIINDTPRQLATVGNLASSERHKYGMKASSKAYAIISKDIYSRPIEAIVREISTNAYDAHVASGKPDLPFHVHIPTSIEPWFSVRDFGDGMSDETIKNVLTMYFESTKASSNDVVGCMGLGSKSPYAYTDNFVITSIHNGVKTIYTSFIDDDAAPSIVTMSSEYVGDKEPSGVAVNVPVERSDCMSFVKAAERVYRVFPTQPIFSGEQIEIESTEYTNRDIIPGVSLIDRFYYDNRVGPVVMGTVAYPIQYSQLGKVMRGTIDIINIMHECESCIEYKFDLGELNIQPSREGLQYDKKTITALKTKMLSFFDVMLGKLVNEVNQYTDDLGRKLALYRVISSNHWYEKAFSYYRQPFKSMDYHGSPLESIMDLRKFHENYMKFEYEPIDNQGFELKFRNAKINHSINEFSPAQVINYQKHFYIKDISKNVLSRITKISSEINQSACLDVGATLIVPTSETMDLSALKKMLGAPDDYEFPLLSSVELPKQPKAGTATPSKREKKPPMAYSVVHSGYNSTKTSWSESTLDSIIEYTKDSNPVFYYEIKGHAPVDPDISANFKLARMFSETYLNAAFNAGRLFALRKDAVGVVKSLPNWVNIIEFVQQNPSYFLNIIANATNNVTKEYGIAFMHEINKKEVKDPLVVDIIELGITENKVAEHRSAITERARKKIARLFGINEVEMVNKKLEKVTQFLDKYPMIAAFSSYRNSHVPKKYHSTIIDYFNGIHAATLQEK